MEAQIDGNITIHPLSKVMRYVQAVVNSCPTRLRLPKAHVEVVCTSSAHVRDLIGAADMRAFGRLTSLYTTRQD